MFFNTVIIIFAFIVAAGQRNLDAQSSLLSDPDVDSLTRKLHNNLPRIEAIRRIGGTAGMSIGVMYRGQKVLEHNFGYSDLEKGEEPTSSTIYPLGSLTKAFVATTIAQLVHDGLLSWDEPVTSYIPELLFEADESLELTLIDLLSHQTGLARLDVLWLGAGGEIIIPKNFTVTMCNYLVPVYPLRSTWLYNNWMYALAGEVVERVTGSSLGDVLAKRVFAKLGLGQTTLLKSDIQADKVASPYLVLDNKTLVRSPDLGMTDGILMSSAGGIRSNVRDMLKWGHSILSPFREGTAALEQLDVVLSGHSFLNKTSGFDELYGLGFAKVTTPAQFGKMGFNPGFLDDGMPVIGANSRPRRVFYHNGAITGYNNCLMLVPELEAVIVVLTNSISQGDVADWASQAILQVVLELDSPIDLEPMAEKAAEKWKRTHGEIAESLEKEKIPNTREPSHHELVGRYWHTTRALAIDVFEDNGDLKFNINGQQSQMHTLTHYNHDSFSLLPSADDRVRRGLFHYETEAYLLHFQKDSMGQFDRLLWKIGGGSLGGEVFRKIVS
ncbi:putative Beta-lactamase-related domain-containing protein [Seiridium cardinale]